ncbi:hypothetical protein MMC13_002742 [Lambiella insularis]|nr:hypothetical protein [Lambiella insularis]
MLIHDPSDLKFIRDCFSQVNKELTAVILPTCSAHPINYSSSLRLQQRTTPVQSISPYRRAHLLNIQTTAKPRAQTRSTVPSTNPEDTKELWDTVRRQMSGDSKEPEVFEGRVLRKRRSTASRTRSTGKSSQTTSTKSSSIPSKTEKAKLRDPKESGAFKRHVPRKGTSVASRTTSPTKLSQTTSTQSPAISSKTEKTKLRDPDFCPKVLLPRGVEFPSEREQSNAFAHFNTDELDDDIEVYRKIAPGSDTEVWIRTEGELVEKVVAQYKKMHNKKRCEAEFSSYAKEKLLKGNPAEGTREWRTERTLELVSKPRTQWESPPVITDAGVTDANTDASAAEYDFRFRPDCQYWLSIQSFNQRYTPLFSRYVHVLDEDILCPYFSIEFKKDDTTKRMVQNQVAVDAIVALYNRCLLKVKRLKLTGMLWTRKHTTSLRHYGLTLLGHKFKFWCFRLKEQGRGEPVSPTLWKWPGCEMIEASPGSLKNEYSVKNFINWTNEIHRWGLTVHGPSCQQDLQMCVDSSEKYVRTSLGENADSDIEVDELAVARRRRE